MEEIDGGIEKAMQFKRNTSLKENKGSRLYLRF